MPPSVGVEGGGEDDVPADGQRGLLHLAPQDGVAHDARSLPHLLQHLVQPLDAAHHRPLLDVGQPGDLGERLRGESKRFEGFSPDTSVVMFKGPVCKILMTPRMRFCI